MKELSIIVYNAFRHVILKLHYNYIMMELQQKIVSIILKLQL